MHVDKHSDNCIISLASKKKLGTKDLFVYFIFLFFETRSSCVVLDGLKFIMQIKLA